MIKNDGTTEYEHDYGYEYMKIRHTVIAIGALGAAWAAPAAEPVKPAAAPYPVVEPLKPVDISKPDHVVGGGSPDSVTEKGLQSALAKGGVIVFNTGGQPVTLKLTKPLVLPQGAKPAVIDGLGLVTLDGDGKTRILQKEWKTELTVQRLRFQHARVDKEGAAIWNVNWDGRLTVIDCQFEDCKTTEPGPDIGGGAIRVTGQRHLTVSGCSFVDCAGSNGGAICLIGCQLSIVNCTFQRNAAFGTGGGADRGPLGKGGIGGAVYVDGVSQNGEQKQLFIGGSLFQENRAGDHAGAVFGYTLPKAGSTSVYVNSIFENNTVDEPKDRGLGFAGAVYSQYCHLHVVGCTFANNRAPRLVGSLFTAELESEHVENCEFYGNKPEYDGRGGANVSRSRRDVPPAVAALGRMPGVAAPAKKPKAEPAPAAATAPPPPPPAPPRPADEAALKERDALLRTSVLAKLRAGTKPKFVFSMVGGPAEIASLDEKGEMKLNAAGSALFFAWANLKLDDKRALAVGLASSEEPGDLALAAFYSLAAAGEKAAEPYLRRLNEKDLEAVKTAFK